MKKKLLPIIAIAFGLSLSLCACANPFSLINSGGKLESVLDPEMHCEYTEGLGYYVTITGALKNTGKRTYSYVAVTFTLYDAEGYNIGTALDNMTNLNAGDSWKYEAESFEWFDAPPASCKCTDISCF